MPAKKISNIKDKKSNIKVTKRRSVSKTPSTAVVGSSPLSAGEAGRKSVGKVTLRAEVYDTKGKVVEKVSLPQEIFGAKINKPLLSQAVRVYLANQRQGTAKTKDRGEVNATTKKVWQQKGTGRARHGSKRAPIFVGGGVAFGPRPRDYSLNLSKKMKKAALFSALSSKFKENQIKVVEGLEKIMPKTRMMAEILGNLGLSDNKRILLVTPKSNSLENIYRAARNIEGIEVASADILNTYRVLDNKSILLMKMAIDSIKNTFLKEK